jgi:hypothetical protein
MAEATEARPAGMILAAFTATPIPAIRNLRQWAMQAHGNFEALGRALQGSMTYALVCQQGLLQFTVMRLQKDMDMLQELGTAGDRADMVRILSDFHRTLRQDYVNEIKYLADKGLQILPDSVGPLQERAKATVEGLPKVA